VPGEQSWVKTRISSNVSVAFPAKAAYQWNKKEQLYTYATAEVSLSVLVKKLPDQLKGTPADQRTLLEGAIHGFLQNAGTTLISNKEIVLGTVTAKEIQYQVKHPMLDSYSTGYTRYFVVDRLLYAVQCFFLAPEHQESRQLKDQFFNSISIAR